MLAGGVQCALHTMPPFPVRLQPSREPCERRGGTHIGCRTRFSFARDPLATHRRILRGHLGQPAGMSRRSPRCRPSTQTLNRHEQVSGRLINVTASSCVIDDVSAREDRTGRPALSVRSHDFRRWLSRFRRICYLSAGQLGPSSFEPGRLCDRLCEPRVPHRR